MLQTLGAGEVRLTSPRTITPVFAGTVVVTLLLSAARRMGWRVVPQSNIGPPVKRRKSLQFSTWHLLLTVTGIAALLGVLPWLSDQRYPPEVTTAVAVAMFFALSVLALAGASLGRRRPLRRILVLVPFIAALAFALTWTARLPPAWLDPLSLSAAALAGLGSLGFGLALLACRMRGYRLSRTPASSGQLTAKLINFPTAGIVTAIVAALTVLPAIQKSRRQAQAAGALRTLGASVVREQGEYRRIWFPGSRYGTSVSDDTLIALREMTELIELRLAEEAITDAGLQHVRCLRKLQKLDLANTQITADGLGQLKPLSRLTLLNISGTPAATIGLRQLQRGHPSLPFVGAEDLSDADYQAVAAMRALGASVEVIDTTVVSVAARTNARAILEHVGKLTSIHSVVCKGRAVTDDDLAHLQRHLDLTKLVLIDTSVTDTGLEQLKSLKNLQMLHLTNSPITDEGLFHLPALSSLAILSLDGTGITDAGLRHLTGLSSLYKLNLARTSVTDRGLSHLSPLWALEELDLSGTSITNDGLAHLRTLNRLRHLMLRATAVDGGALKHLRRLLALGFVDVADSQVSPEAAETLRSALRRTRVVRE